MFSIQEMIEDAIYMEPEEYAKKYGEPKV